MDELDALEFEMILRRIDALKTGKDEGRGSLDGYAEADIWRGLIHSIINIKNDNEEKGLMFDNTLEAIKDIKDILIGILKSLKIIEEKLK